MTTQDMTKLPTFNGTIDPATIALTPEEIEASTAPAWGEVAAASAEAAVAAEADRVEVITRPGTRKLKVTLSAVEVTACAHRALAAEHLIANLKIERSGINEGIKSAEQDRKNAIVAGASSFGERDVPYTHIRVIHSTNTREFIDANGVVIDTEALTPEDRQAELPFDDGVDDEPFCADDDGDGSDNDDEPDSDDGGDGPEPPESGPSISDPAALLAAAAAAPEAEADAVVPKVGPGRGRKKKAS